MKTQNMILNDYDITLANRKTVQKIRVYLKKSEKYRFLNSDNKS